MALLNQLNQGLDLDQKEKFPSPFSMHSTIEANTLSITKGKLSLFPEKGYDIRRLRARIRCKFRIVELFLFTELYCCSQRQSRKKLTRNYSGLTVSPDIPLRMSTNILTWKTKLLLSTLDLTLKTAAELTASRVQLHSIQVAKARGHSKLI